MRRLLRSCLVFCSVCLLGSTAALAQGSPLNPARRNAHDAVDKGPAPFPLHVSASLTQSVGSGTFILDRYSDNPALVSSLDINPSANLWGGTFLYSQSFSFEETAPDNPTGRRLDYSDPRLIASFPVLNLGKLGLSARLAGGTALPLSQNSRQAGTLFSPFASARMTWLVPVVEGLGASLGANVRYNVISRSLAGRGLSKANKGTYQNSLGQTAITTACFVRGGESQADACIGPTTAASLSESLAVFYHHGDITISASLLALHLIDGFWAGQDDLASENAVSSLLPTNLSNGTLSVTYNALDWLALTAGTSSFQSMLRSQGGSYLNPLNYRIAFWDFEGAAANRSSVFFSMTASY